MTRMTFKLASGSQLIVMNCYIRGNIRGRRGARARGCDATVMGLILTRGYELLFINIFISSLWHQGKKVQLAKAGVRCENLVKSREPSVDIWCLLAL